MTTGLGMNLCSVLKHTHTERETFTSFSFSLPLHTLHSLSVNCVEFVRGETGIREALALNLTKENISIQSVRRDGHDQRLCQGILRR